MIKININKSDLSKLDEIEGKNDIEIGTIDYSEEVLKLFKLPLVYDSYGQIIFDSNNQIVADVRAWGYLQYKKNGEKLQDTLGQMLVDSFNKNYLNRSKHEKIHINLFV